ncbi:endonuclease I family protein [Galbibacter pacificus]|uniref:Endonuclease n=1 Tax=Galbibacter pacificus TaxID=2996052 RepID=A0ABT6FNY7_9FLAO|nr:endonuclease [Galbibacter pacificus]MDG3581500.1 endonuclease [Galbibacter pacificus]MDG3584978.1 endonuclease [Galbibacter pacificus]
MFFPPLKLCIAQKIGFLCICFFALGGCKDNLANKDTPVALNDPRKDSTEIQVPKKLLNYYKDVDFNLRTIPLYEALATVTIAKHTTILSYRERHKYLYRVDAVPQQQDSVVLIYSGEHRYWEEYVSGNNRHEPQTFNTEHVYPQSLIENTAKGDLHHLRVCDQTVNTRRSNNPFSEGSGTYKLHYKSWYPGDEWKGDVARMILYLNLRYNETFEDVGNIKLFLKWNAEDPVSSFEEQRNNSIEKIQGNRNPFIDNPHLATFIWGGPNAENKWD